MRLFAVARLVRIAALPSALADVFGGMALVYALTAGPGLSRLPWLMLTTVGVYLGGMALNDVLHVRKDGLLRKARPIVAGELSFNAAWSIMAALFVLGLVGAFMAGIVAWTCLLIVLVFLYNWLASGSINGASVSNPLPRAAASVAVIALCRALHVSLPLLAHADWQLVIRQPLWQLFAGSVFVYFCLVTLLSLFEDRGGGRRALRFVSWALFPVVLALPAYLLLQEGEAEPVWGILAPLLALTWLLIVLLHAIDQARAEPTPSKIGRAVGAGIRGEALLMCGFALLVAAGQWWWGMLALACYPTGRLLSRWISPT